MKERREGNPLTLLVGMQTSTALWRTVWRFLKKLEIELPYDPAVPLLGIHTEETRRERDIAALFTIARIWKQSRCPSADEWITKLWYIYTMEYFSAIKKNAFESVLMMEKAMATHSSTLAWKIPWMEEPGRLQSMGSRRVGHLLSNFTFTFHFHTLEKEMATHSSVLAWRIPGTAEPGGLPSVGSHRVGHD